MSQYFDWRDGKVQSNHRRPHSIDRPESKPAGTPEDALLELADRALDAIERGGVKPHRIDALVTVTIALRPLKREDRVRVALDALALLSISPSELVVIDQEARRLVQFDEEVTL
jgi:hypothetical protein